MSFGRTYELLIACLDNDHSPCTWYRCKPPIDARAIMKAGATAPNLMAEGIMRAAGIPDFHGIR